MASNPQLGSSLRMWRLRLSKDATTLGSRRRLPCRVGRLVTQEELAEAVGVSRSWYKMLECSVGVRTSLRLLVGLGEALMLSPSEKAHLFCLAFPELAVFEMVTSADPASTSRPIGVVYEHE
jgi:transcriptional regulator with XRE-family HTH domain